MRKANLKSLVSVCTALLATVLLAAVPHAAVTTVPVAYYPFNGNAYDVGGNEYNGNVLGNLSYVNGVSDSAAHFDGSSHVDLSYIQVPQNFTFSSWISIDQQLTPDQAYAIYNIYQENNGGYNLAYICHGEDGQHYIIMEVWSGDINNWKACQLKYLFEPCRFYHLSAVYDSVQRTIKVYIDGVLEGSLTDVGPPGGDHWKVGTESHLGRGYYGGNASYLKGILDEVRIYEQALSAAEISELYTQTSDSAKDGGFSVTSELWMKAVLKVPGNPIDLIWKMVGADITPSGDQVVSGYFYADPDDFAYGSIYNPEVFVKIYISSGGWCNLAVNHVTVDDVDVYSAHPYTGSADQRGIVSLNDRLLEHQYTGVGIDSSLKAATPSPNADIPIDHDGGYILSSDLWSKTVLQVPGNPLTLVWKSVGSDTTPSGDLVVSGYYYADPTNFAYGSVYNPEIFVKIYIAVNGWANIAFNHVTVDKVDIVSAHHYSGFADQSGTASLNGRLVEHQYNNVLISSIDVTKFYGNYTINETTGSCSWAYTLTIGNDLEKINDDIQGEEYIYLAPSQAVTIYPDGVKTVKVSNDTIQVYENDGEESSEYIYLFSNDYDRIELSGTVNDANHPSCSGEVTGEGRRIINSIVGSWGQGYGNGYASGGSDFGSLTFYPNGYYIHWQSDKKDEPYDMGGGVEYGTYTYNADIGYGTFHPIVDENGIIGLSDNGQDGIGYAIVEDNVLYIGSYAFEKVESNSSLIVGGWGPGYTNGYQSGGSDFISLTFYSNGYYIHWQSDKKDEPHDMGGGVEYGTYTYDANTDFIKIYPIADENGSIGLSEDGQNSEGYIDVDENELSIGGFLFQRVAED